VKPKKKIERSSKFFFRFEGTEGSWEKSWRKGSAEARLKVQSRGKEAYCGSKFEVSEPCSRRKREEIGRGTNVKW